MTHIAIAGPATTDRAAERRLVAALTALGNLYGPLTVAAAAAKLSHPTTTAHGAAASA